MLVPKPKKAFQSPGVNSFGLNPVIDVVVVIAGSSQWRAASKKRRAMPAG
jgi:hypothetical protein